MRFWEALALGISPCTLARPREHHEYAGMVFSHHFQMMDVRV